MVIPAQKNRPGNNLVIDQVTSGDVTYLELRSASFEDGAAIPQRNAADRDNISPALQWRRGPEPTRSYALIVEDPDAPGGSPFVHWIVYNLPPDGIELEENREDHPVLQKPAEALQGLSDNGTLGYFGPRPPEGDPDHRYFFQIFALDRVLPLHYGATRTALVESMSGHVLAAGVLMGTYKR